MRHDINISQCLQGFAACPNESDARKARRIANELAMYAPARVVAGLVMDMDASRPGEGPPFRSGVPAYNGFLAGFLKFG